jgi:glycine oxidase
VTSGVKALIILFMLWQGSGTLSDRSQFFMEQVTIIGCGIIGATIAYELSCLGKFEIVVYDAGQPAQASTGAALGILMGIISQKVKGRAWNWRDYSIRHYHQLIPELERLTGLQIPHNRQGILKLLAPTDDLSKWVQLATTRAQQQWRLELWSSAQISAQVPQLNTQLGSTAVYSPQDLQVDPVALTHALIAAARLNGVDFQFDRSIESIAADHPHSCDLFTHDRSTLTSDWVIVTAGLGATKLLAPLAPIEINPVLGQAIQIRLPQPLGNPDFQPVITHADVNIVPCGDNEYWIGATVEFPVDGLVVAQSDCLERLKQIAINLCPDLAKGEIMRTWTGLRPRPHQRPAPVIERLLGLNDRVLVATGHYRNGVLLAPATARIVAEMLAE